MAKADGGILFLDEIHRLPPEGQEMLFTFIDKGVYRPLEKVVKPMKPLFKLLVRQRNPQKTFNHF